jgi:hypothetical protein
MVAIDDLKLKAVNPFGIMKRLSKLIKKQDEYNKKYFLLKIIDLLNLLQYFLYKMKT